MPFADSAALRDLADAAREQRWLGLDVEFNSERTYHARLALIQAAVGKVFLLVDPVQDSPDMGPLADVFADPSVVKVLHSPDQDLPILARALGVYPRNVFDTQTAAAVAGVGEGSQIGYAWLVEEFTGINLTKAARRTDWLRRPLSPAQLEYALDDVRHLRTIQDGLLERLRELGRVEWVEEDCRRFESPELFDPDARLAWTRCKGASGVTAPEDRAVLQELAAWREARAERADRPRRWLIEDKALIDLARTHPRPRADQIAEIAELTHRQERQWANELAQAIVRGAKRPPPPAVAPLRLPKHDEAEVRRLVSLVKSRAAELGVSPPALATSGDVRRIFALGSEADVRTLTGWRRHEIGDALLEAVVDS